jgi:hypothetical protein
VIFTILAILLKALVYAITLPLPQVTWTPDTTGFEHVIGVMKELNIGLPVAEATLMTGVTLLVLSGLLIWRGIHVIKAWIPGLGGDDG